MSCRGCSWCQLYTTMVWCSSSVVVLLLGVYSRMGQEQLGAGVAPHELVRMLLCCGQCMPGLGWM